MQNDFITIPTERARSLADLRAKAQRLGTSWLEAIVEPYGEVLLCDLPPHAVAAALRDDDAIQIIS